MFGPCVNLRIPSIDRDQFVTTRTRNERYGFVEYLLPDSVNLALNNIHKTDAKIRVCVNNFMPN